MPFSLFFFFTDKETEAHRGQVIFPTLHSLYMGDSGLEPTSVAAEPELSHTVLYNSTLYSLSILKESRKQLMGT